MRLSLNSRVYDTRRGSGKRTCVEASYSAVRALLRILEQKGHPRHQQDGPRYIFVPIVSRDRARRSALRNLVRTFVDGSPAQAAAALIDQAPLSDEEFNQLANAIDKAQRGAVAFELVGAGVGLTK